MIKLPPLDPYAGATADRNGTNFPIRANGLTYVDTEADVLYVYASGAWHGLGGGVPEPDDDGETYGRKTDGASSWVAVVPATGGTFSGGVTVNGSFVVNDAAADVDSRIEGTGDPNLTYWDAGNNRVGFGTDTPTQRIDSVFSTTGANYMRIYNANTAGFSGMYAVGDLGGIVSQVVGSTDALTGFAGWGRVRTDSGLNGLFLGTGGAKPVVISTNGTTRITVLNGMVVGTPTGGDKGVGTINAQAVYDDNVLLSDYILDLYYDGKMSAEDEKKHPNARLWSIEETAVFTEENHHLPTMPGRAEWESGSKSLGELVTRLWETVEQQQLQIFELSNKLKAVKNG